MTVPIASLAIFLPSFPTSSKSCGPRSRTVKRRPRTAEPESAAVDEVIVSEDSAAAAAEFEPVRGDITITLALSVTLSIDVKHCTNTTHTNEKSHARAPLNRISFPDISFDT
jgi:hypothetical protein